MGYHDYQNIWKSTMKEKLEARVEPDNAMDKFAVAMVKKEIRKRIMKGKIGRFAKAIFSWEQAHAVTLMFKLLVKQ